MGTFPRLNTLKGMFTLQWSVSSAHKKSRHNINNLDLLINPQRFKEDFDALAHIGAQPDGGISRPAFSPAHLAARAWLRDRITAAGLELRVDGAGNHSGICRCGPEGARTLLLGSHTDSVPDGGCFDGALGVVAALETVRRVHESGLHLPYHLEVIDFTDQEGVLVSFLGSFALCGRLTIRELQKPRGGRTALEKALLHNGLSVLDILSARRPPRELAGYLELHIEQGPLLEQAGIPLGVVEGISGIRFYHLTFTGRADHAGTFPMEKRRDASLGAAGFTLAARQRVLDNFPGCYMNVGRAQYEPGLFNIVPRQVTLDFECRAILPGTIERLAETLVGVANQQARLYELGLTVVELGRREPTRLDERMKECVRQAADALDIRYMPIVSGPGHDAQALAGIVPTAMIFVPSINGISHSPLEMTNWEDCVNGAHVLLQATLRAAYLDSPA